MKKGPIGALVVGLVLGAGLLVATREVLLLPVAVLLVLAPTVLAGWWQARENVRRYFSRPPDLAWSEERLSLDSAAEAALEELGYRYAGTLYRTEDEAGSGVSAVYIHEALPIYAFLFPPYAGPGEPGARAQLDTFMEGGGRLTTTGLPATEFVAACGDNAALRLLQRRVGGTPAALDGQHVGTVRAWMAGKRQPLPATREALIGYLEADLEQRRRLLEKKGWVPLLDFVRAVVGMSRGVLKF